MEFVRQRASNAAPRIYNAPSAESLRNNLIKLAKQDLSLTKVAVKTDGRCRENFYS